jgi:hypothetical protein
MQRPRKRPIALISTAKRSSGSSARVLDAGGKSKPEFLFEKTRGKNKSSASKRAKHEFIVRGSSRGLDPPGLGCKLRRNYDPSSSRN